MILTSNRYFYETLLNWLRGWKLLLIDVVWQRRRRRRRQRVRNSASRRKWICTSQYQQFKCDNQFFPLFSSSSFFLPFGFFFPSPFLFRVTFSLSLDVIAHWTWNVCRTLCFAADQLLAQNGVDSLAIILWRVEEEREEERERERGGERKEEGYGSSGKTFSYYL